MDVSEACKIQERMQKRASQPPSSHTLTLLLTLYQTVTFSTGHKSKLLQMKNQIWLQSVFSSKG